MVRELVTGSSTLGAVVRGLLVGLALQALLIGTIQVSGPPIHPDVAVELAYTQR